MVKKSPTSEGLTTLLVQLHTAVTLDLVTRAQPLPPDHPLWSAYRAVAAELYGMDGPPEPGGGLSLDRLAQLARETAALTQLAEACRHQVSGSALPGSVRDYRDLLGEIARLRTLIGLPLPPDFPPALSSCVPS